MAITNRRKNVNHKPILNTAIKRKIGYETLEEKVSDTRRKFVNMSMNKRCDEHHGEEDIVNTSNMSL